MTCQIVGCNNKRQQTFLSAHVNGGLPVEVCDHHYVELQKIGPDTETDLEVEADGDTGEPDDAERADAEDGGGAQAIADDTYMPELQA